MGMGKQSEIECIHVNLKFECIYVYVMELLCCTPEYSIPL